jgi:transcriptional regulator with XRE-family HTH domain
VQERTPSAVAKAVGVVVFARRTRLGLRQVDLAEQCGLDRAFISFMEHGHRAPTLDTLTCIAQALNTTASELLRDAGY